MALFEDDLEQGKKKPQLRPLDKMSIDELKSWIESLKADIQRAEEEISRKEAHRAAADSFFKKT